MKNFDIGDGNPQEMAQRILEGMKDFEHEGIVFKNYEKQIFAKIKLPKFRETERCRFGGHPKNKDLIIEWLFLEMTMTLERVKHAIQLLEETEEMQWSMKIMPKLFILVFDDAIEEEFLGFYFENKPKNFNFEQARKMSGKYVARHLKYLLEEKVV